MRKCLKFILFIDLLFIGNFAKSQDDYYINFDFGFTIENVFIDTISNSSNSWEIGTPQKDILSNAYSEPNVIITEISNSYPVNDTSSFYIKHIARGDYENGQFAYLEGKYFVNSDTLTDYGKIEFSPDNGTAWYDILSEENTVQFWNGLNNIPVLSGNSNDWKLFRFDTGYFCYSNQINVGWGDTIVYKFTFISDSIDTNKDGLMFDDFRLIDFIESVNEIGMNKIESSCFPNPVQKNITIRFDNPLYEKFDVFIYDVKGSILKTITTNTDLIDLSCEKFEKGLYYYKLVNKKDNLFSFGSFVKE